MRCLDASVKEEPTRCISLNEPFVSFATCSDRSHFILFPASRTPPSLFVLIHFHHLSFVVVLIPYLVANGG